MEIKKVTSRDDFIIEKLFQIWHKSVKVSHLFLSDQEIEAIADYVPMALKQVEMLFIAENDKDEPIGFMGIEQNRLEMLFVLPLETGKGIGKKLLLHAMHEYAVDELCANEDNPKAKAFYEHIGFQAYQRTETDEQGNPYPLLYMKLKKQ